MNKLSFIINILFLFFFKYPLLNNTYIYKCINEFKTNIGFHLGSFTLNEMSKQCLTGSLLEKEFKV